MGVLGARYHSAVGLDGPLQPAALVQSVFGFYNLFLAELIHGVVGVVFYPMGYLFVARPTAPVSTRHLPKSPVRSR